VSVWLTIPSKRPAAEANPVLERWRAQGYQIALWLDGEEAPGKLYDHFLTAPKYPGYAVAVNTLIRSIAAKEPLAEWFVCAGDDTLPDPCKDAETIARECREYFRKHHYGSASQWGKYEGGPLATFGVMQPTGDRWGEPKTPPPPGALQGAPIDRVAGSPFIGREFALRMYGGNGPYWHEFTHMGVDEELRCIAVKHGVYWERRDLVHHHEHWSRKRGQVTDMPDFLRQANSAEHWKRYKQIFEARKAAGFPGSEPL
jgi:hypothetical protein